MHRLALFVAIFALSGCFSSRQVTPWLRTSVTRPFELMAESGGPKPVAKTERLVDGVWLQVSRSRRAMPLSGGKAAIYIADSDGALLLANAAGEDKRLDCRGEIRSRPDGRGLTCMEFRGYVADGAASTLTVKQIDLAGATTSTRTFEIPEGTIPRDYFGHFPGFLPSGLPLYTVHVTNEDLLVHGNRTQLCIAFAAGPGRLTKLASVVSDDWPSCGDASFWSDLHVEPGDTLGE